MDDLERLAGGKYVSLTTFRRDGTPVATPVWVVRDGEHLGVITKAETGKVKRLRHTTAVRVAPCTVRGQVTGPAVDGVAELMDEIGSARVRDFVGAKYGLTAKAMGWLDVAVHNRGKSQADIGVRIALGASR